METIRCKLCGHMAVCLNTDDTATKMPPEDIPKAQEGDRKRQRRREQLTADGVGLDDIGVQFGDECGAYAHDYERQSNSEMVFGREVKEYLGRWPTKVEIRVAVKAARKVSERETPIWMGCDPPSNGEHSSCCVGDITDCIHVGYKGDRQESRQRWQEMRLEMWREMMNEPHVLRRVRSADS